MAGLTLDKRVLKERIESVLSFFAVLSKNFNRTPMTLSGGERQLLTLAMAMLHQPKMILFDEPFTGLSPKNMELILCELMYINEANLITLIIVEHRLKKSIKLASKMIGMKLGKVVCEFSTTNAIDYNRLNMIFI